MTEGSAAVPSPEQLERLQIETPALGLDTIALRSNIERMRDSLARQPAALRPHFKAHKCIEIARAQCDAGAIGMTTATVSEATSLLDAGVDNIFVANEIADRKALHRLAGAVGEATVAVAVDSETTVRLLAEAAIETGTELGAIIEVDIGMAKGGIADGLEALALARQIVEHPGLRFDGISGWEGHCADDLDYPSRCARTTKAIDLLLGVADTLTRAGLAPAVVSAGGTGTYDITGGIEGITDVQAGTYAVMDEYHRGFRREFEQAVFVLATVIGRRGSHVVLNVGRKGIAGDLAPIRPPAGWQQTLIHEEHSGFTVPSRVPEVGTVVPLVPGDAPNTANLYSHYCVVDEGKPGEVWPVVGRYGDE